MKLPSIPMVHYKNIEMNHPVFLECKTKFKGRFYKKLGDSYGWSFPETAKFEIEKKLKEYLAQQKIKEMVDASTQTEEGSFESKKKYRYDLPQEFKNEFKHYHDIFN